MTDPRRTGRDRDWNWPLIRTRCLIEARRMLRGEDDAEEVVQEALARAWRHQSACRTPDAPIPWCLQITRNEALRELGRRRVNASAQPLDEETAVRDERALAEGERTLARIDVSRALRVLTVHERQLIAMRYDKDFSHLEIAARLGIPEVTARVRLHRAHAHLKPHLREPS